MAYCWYHLLKTAASLLVACLSQLAAGVCHALVLQAHRACVSTLPTNQPCWLVAALQDFVDERDSGVIYVTHFTLLLGLAVPMWLCLGLPGADGFAGSHSGSHIGTMLCSGSSNSSGSEGNCLAAATSSDAVVGSIYSGFSIGDGSRGSAGALLLVTAGLSGMVIIGVGDTAASMVGKLLGRVPIHAGSRKTVEGTVAGIASSLGAWCLLLWAGGMGVPGGMSWCWWLQLVLATAGAGLMEAVTSQLDNVLLPLWYLPHLLLVQQ